MAPMTHRERLMTAMRNGMPDRVPVAPDISNMVPCRLTGKPFWEVYINQNPPLWRAFIHAAKHLGIEGWFMYADPGYQRRLETTTESSVVARTPEYWDQRTVIHTPAGDLTSIMRSPAANSPTTIEKIIKNFKEDFPKLRYLYPEITGFDPATLEVQRAELGEAGILETSIIAPGLHLFCVFFDGSLEAATFAYYDHPDLFEEWRELHHRQCVRQTELAIEAGVDSILTGGSGSITLQSPTIWREMSLPTIKAVAKMCREAGVICGIHSCGKERYMVETCAAETDLCYINPLEIPPMGDCDLGECKTRWGDRLALMGNLHTTDVMLRGSTEKVRLESLRAIRAAGEGGGYILSTGDQCGRDTPDENIRAMVETAETFGRYPLDVGRIDEEIERLARVVER